MRPGEWRPVAWGTAILLVLVACGALLSGRISPPIPEPAPPPGLPAAVNARLSTYMEQVRLRVGLANQQSQLDRLWSGVAAREQALAGAGQAQEAAALHAMLAPIKTASDLKRGHLTSR